MTSLLSSLSIGHKSAVATSAVKIVSEKTDDGSRCACAARTIRQAFLDVLTAELVACQLCRPKGSRDGFSALPALRAFEKFARSANRQQSALAACVSDLYSLFA